MKLVIASNNKHKVTEIKAILGPYFDEILSLRDAGISIDVEEPPKTLGEFVELVEIARIVGFGHVGDDVDDHVVVVVEAR